MTLQEQIEVARQTIKAEAYSMSIGELVNLYRDNELIIRPEFQRLFRWNESQKSRLIESILLGIPLPSIFVMQRNDSVWEVIDGMQRLSTILEFMGELKNEATGVNVPPSTLSKTTYLPDLEGVQYENQGGHEFSAGQRISFKRAKLDLKILLPESDSKSKFELFDRLNAGGSVATPQEVRNALILMRNPSFFEWLETLRLDSHFQNTLTLTDRLVAEAYDAELVCRFIVLNNSSNSDLTKIDNIDKFISDTILDLSVNPTFDKISQKREFLQIFKMLDEALGESSFKRYDSNTNRFLGGFSVSAFESITVGLSDNLDTWENKKSITELSERVKGLWSNADFRGGSGSGVRSSTRINKTIPAARNFFQS